MSIKVSAWVWKHAKQKHHRGTVKLLLLALADHANDQGICWPSAATLADEINESERHTRQLIKQLSDKGDVLVIPGGGRGNTTHYAVAVGLSDGQRAKLKDALQNTVSKNTVRGNSETETVISGDENSVLQRTETVISGDPVEGTNSASESVKPTRKTGGNRNRTIIEPSNNTPRADRAPSPDDSLKAEHQALMAAYQGWLGYQIPNGGKEGAAARKLLQNGYTIEQVDACYHELKSRDFYSAQHLSLQTVYEQIGAVSKFKSVIKARDVAFRGEPIERRQPRDRAAVAAEARRLAEMAARGELP